MSSHAPKVDPIAKIVFIIGLLAIVAAVYVLLSSLINTFERNSTKGEVDKTQLILNAEDNIKRIGFSSLSGAPVASAAGRGGKEIYDAVCTSCHTTGVLDSPKLGDKAAWEARAAIGLDALVTSAINGKGSMPAKGGDPSLSDSEMRAVVLYMTKESGLDLGSETVETVEKTEAPVATAETKEQSAQIENTTKDTTVAAVTTQANSAPTVEGRKTYDLACFACHATGVAGSPKLGDKVAWAPRIATGIESLYNTSINGKGAMPPKGGNMSLSDDAVKAAVDYMISEAK